MNIGSYEYEGMEVPQFLDFDAEFKVEPVSGTTVYSESVNTIKVAFVSGMAIPVYISDLAFTEGTITDLVNTARSANIQLLWAQVYGFWLVFGVGSLLILLGIVKTIRHKPKKIQPSL